MECCKVGRVIENRRLTVHADDEDIHDYLAARWIGKEGYPAVGVRKLADWFNEKLLREVYLANGRSVTDIRISSEYAVLSGDDEIEKGEVIDDLESDGIDGDALVSDFVSRSTMRRHLRNCLGVEKDDTQNEPTSSNWETDRIQYSQEHLRQNIEDAITSLTNKGKLPGGTEADIDIPIFLSCPECKTQVRLQTALKRQFICREHLGAGVSPDLGVPNTSD